MDRVAEGRGLGQEAAGAGGGGAGAAAWPDCPMSSASLSTLERSWNILFLSSL